MFCPKCGNQLPEGANFCPKCGSEFPKEREENIPNAYQTNTQNSGNSMGKIHRTATELRKEARKSLTQKWGKSALIIFVQNVIIFAINFVIAYISLLPFYENPNSPTALSISRMVVSIVSAIIGVPLSFGIIASFMKIKRVEEVKTLDFWKIGLKNFVRSWKICLWIALKMIVVVAIAYVVCILIGILIPLLSGMLGIGSDTETFIFTTMILIEFIVAIIALIILIVIGLNYVIANNIAYDEPNITAKEAVEKSKRLMKGRKGDYIVLMLSFIGWAILTLFTYGIGIFWLNPYIYVTQVCFYDHIREDEGV